MSRLTRDGTAEPVSRDQILRREGEEKNIHFYCPADHKQECPVDLYSAEGADHPFVKCSYYFFAVANIR